MMSEGKTPPGELDAVLAAWPTAERTALEWDESAERVLSLIGSGDKTGRTKASGRVSDEDLLRPPLPTTPDEVQSSAPTETRTEGATGMTTASRERDRAGFRDLARLANMTPPPSSVSSVRSAETSAPGAEKKEWEANSGVIDLAAIAKNEAAEAKAKAPVSAAAVAQATMRSAGNEPKPIAEPKSLAVAREEKREKKGSPWVAIGGVVAAAAVAAGVFFGMQHTDRAVSPAAVAVAPPPATTAAPQPIAAATPPAATPLTPEERGVDPASLPPASTGAAATGAVALHGPAPLVAAKPGAATAPTTDPALVAAIPTATAAPTASASLSTLMQQAAGVTSSPTATVVATATDDDRLPAPGSVPLKPSQGAIQGSLGAALPSARGCLGPDDPISHATITFKSDGTVQSVGVSGGAAGKPAEACIRAALSKARVTPFAQPTFTATATVRPN
jgi:hypothetical protein